MPDWLIALVITGAIIGGTCGALVLLLRWKRRRTERQALAFVRAFSGRR